MLHNDNAPCHTSFITRDFLAKNSIIVVLHPSYSLDLAPCDMGLLPKLKIRLNGRRCESIKEIQTVSQAVLDAFTENNFQKIFRQWKKRWDRCIDVFKKELLRRWCPSQSPRFNVPCSGASVRGFLDSSSYVIFSIIFLFWLIGLIFIRISFTHLVTFYFCIFFFFLIIIF